uniref:Peptidase S1 domain-containing protein n=1 Tax=Timema monikensis TaxID=170555 RepID=A0A7R9HQA2_9NEOP|nr:unnamed protein product [Timema monikensis]
MSRYFYLESTTMCSCQMNQKPTHDTSRNPPNQEQSYDIFRFQKIKAPFHGSSKFPGANITMNHLTTLPGTRRTMNQLREIPGYSRTTHQITAVLGDSRTIDQLTAVPADSKTINQLIAVPDDSRTIENPLTVSGARSAMNNITIFMLAAFLLLDFPMRGQACPEPLTCLPREECVSRLRGHTQAQTDILFVCSSAHGENTICCPAVESLEEWDASSTVAVPLRSSVHPSLHLMPSGDACDVLSLERIRNGIVAEQGQFPWMTLLGYRLSDGKLYFLCGGTLINRRYVLTAAHCLQPEGATLELVRLGELDTNTEQDCEEPYPGEKICADPVLDINIEKVVKHKSFNIPFLKNDIALLRLVSEVPSYTGKSRPTRNVCMKRFYNDFIRPICLPFGLNLNRDEAKKYQVAGWGKTEHCEFTLFAWMITAGMFIHMGHIGPYIKWLAGARQSTRGPPPPQFTLHSLTNDLGRDYANLLVIPSGRCLGSTPSRHYQKRNIPQAGVGNLLPHSNQGSHYEDNTVGSAKLMYTFLQNVPLEDCDSSQAPEVRPLDQTQLCAGVWFIVPKSPSYLPPGNLGKDACRGDSGGPLMGKIESPTTSQQQTYQLGIVSFGSIPCGSNKAPSVFTRVSEYLDWILDNIYP